jgi:hypothetical protein
MSTITLPCEMYIDSAEARSAVDYCLRHETPIDCLRLVDGHTIAVDEERLGAFGARAGNGSYDQHLERLLGDVRRHGYLLSVGGTL